jgi:hypothetical protein
VITPEQAHDMAADLRPATPAAAFIAGLIVGQLRQWDLPIEIGQTDEGEVTGAMCVEYNGRRLVVLAWEVPE